MSTGFNDRFFIRCLLMAGFLILTSCEEKTDWDLDSQLINTVVVDAILTNELKVQHIRLTRPYTDQNGQPEAVSGALVTVGSGNSQVLFHESPEMPGVYLSEIIFGASLNNTYDLMIQDQEKKYHSHASMIPVMPSQLPQWIYNPEQKLYSLQWPEGPYSPFEQAMYEAVITWAHLVDPSLQDTIPYARILHYTFNTIDVNYSIFPQDREEVFFPKNSIAFVRKYSLTNEYADYLRSLLAEAEWQGSLFEDARGNLPGNILNGGLGFFSACSVISDTLVVGN